MRELETIRILCRGVRRPVGSLGQCKTVGSLRNGATIRSAACEGVKQQNRLGARKECIASEGMTVGSMCSDGYAPGIRIWTGCLLPSC